MLGMYIRGLYCYQATSFINFHCIYIIGISISTANKTLRFTESYAWATDTTNIFQNAKSALLL